MNNSQKLYTAAKSCLNKSMVDDPTVDPSVGCAVSVNAVYEKAFGEPLGGGASTEAMYQVLKTDSRFAEVYEPLPGDVIISPTGTSTLGAPHGHVGIVAYYGILSNNSMNGLWQEVYTEQSWAAYYHVKLGFPVLYFRVL